MVRYPSMLLNAWLNGNYTKPVMIRNSYAGDLNETFFVGNVDEESRKLVQCTYECLEKAIAIGTLCIN